MSNDDFFERLRADAHPLRHQPDAATLERIRARIQQRIAPQPSVLDLLAAWFRPIAATMAAVALAAAIGIAATSTSEATTYDDAVEIVMGGETYSVSN